MIKFVVALVLLGAQAASAWEFTPGTPCLLTHETDISSVELTFDPTGPLYSISLTQAAPFVDAPIFSMQFAGQQPISISTDRHQLSNEGRTVTVVDRGFGNVLNGLQFNHTATATLGTQVMSFNLADAADPVAAFRACDTLPSA